MQSGQLHGFFCGTEEPFPLYCRRRSKEKSPAFVERQSQKKHFLQSGQLVVEQKK